MTDLLTEHEEQFLTRLPEVEPWTGEFDAAGRPDLVAGTLLLVDRPTFRAYLIVAGRKRLMLATKGTNDQRSGHTTFADADGYTAEECRRVAEVYFLRLERRVLAALG